MAKGQSRQFVNWHQVKLLSSKPREYGDLAKRIGVSNNCLSNLISRMREKGHTIWTINDGISRLVYYRGGPEIPENFELTIEQIIANDWYDTKELGYLLGLSVKEVTDRLKRISERVKIDKRKSSHSSRLEYKINTLQI